MKKIFFSAKPIVSILAIFILSFAGAVGLRIAIAAWTGPSTAPPGSNVGAPLNVGTDPQTKQGSLTIQQGSSLYVSSNGRFYDDGSYMMYTGPHSFYITSGANTAYIYSNNIYLGPSGGSNVYFRGSTLTGTEWSLNATGNLDVDCITLGTSGPKCSWADVTGITGSGSSNYISKWTTATTLGNSQIYDNGTNVGIGTAAPAQKLHVAGNLRVDGAIVAPEGTLRDDGGGWMRTYGATGWYSQSYGGGWYMTDSTYIRNYGSKQVYLTNNLNMGGNDITNVDKMTVNTIDPAYNINGEKFATYVASMTGLKEETTGNVNLKCMNDKCFSIIDFDKAEKGSDLWLFYQVTDFGKNWDNLVALLTPEGKNNIWYEVNSGENQLLIYGEKEGRVSYRLTAPRFDYEKWTNVNSDEGVEGMKVDIKNY